MKRQSTPLAAPCKFQATAPFPSASGATQKTEDFHRRLWEQKRNKGFRS